MPNVYIQGVSREEARRLSRPVAGALSEAVGVGTGEVNLIWRETVTFREGEEVPGSVIVTLSWIERPRADFRRAAERISAALRRELGEGRGIEVEVHDKWDNAFVNGEVIGDWALAHGRSRPGGG